MKTTKATPRIVQILPVLALALVVLPPAARATSTNWTGGAADGLWATSGNWSGSPATVPGTGDTATFNAAAGPGGAVLSLGAGVTINTVFFNTASAAAYTIGAGGVGSETLTLNDGGTIWANATATQNQLFNAAITLGTGAATYNLNDYNSANSLTFAGNLTGGTSGAKTLAVNAALGGTVAIGGLIDNGLGTSIALTKAGAGTLTLTGANTFTGTTTINAGVLNAGVAQVGTTSGPLGASGNIVFGGGALQFSAASAAWDPSARIAAGTTSGAIDIDTAGQNVTFGTGFTTTQTGGLQKLGSGTLTLTNANTYTAASTIWAGTLKLDAGAGGSLAATMPLTFNVGAAPYTISAGSPTFNYDNTTAAGAKSQSLGTLTFTAGEGTVQLTRTAAQTVSLTFSSLAARAAGAVRNFVYGGSPGTIGTDSKINLTGAALGFIDAGAFVNGADYAYMNAAGTYVRAPVYGTDSGFTTADTLTASTHVKLTTTPAAQNNITLNTLKLAGSGVGFPLNGGQTLTLANGGLLKTGGGAVGTITGGIALAPSQELSVRTDTSSDSLTISMPITGTQVMNKSGAGTLTLAAANTFSGATHLNNGTLNLQNQFALQSSTLTMRGGSVVFDSSVSGNAFALGGLAAGAGRGMDIALQNNAAAAIALTAGSNNAATTYGGSLSGAGSLTKVGTGALILSGMSTYTGKTVVQGGTLNYGLPSLNVGVAGPLGAPTGGNATIDLYPGTTFAYNGGQSANPPQSSVPWLAADRTINLAGTGSGTVTLNGNNVNDTWFAFNGPITATGTGARTLRINSQGDRPIYSYAGGIPNMSDGSPVSLLCVWGSGSSTSDGIINLTGTHTFSGPITLTGGGNGTTPGTFLIGGSGSVPNNVLTVVPGGTGVLGNGNYANTITFTPGTVNSVLLYHASPANQTLSGVISGPGAITMGGAGTLTLSGANYYSGDTALVAGTLVVSNRFALRNSALNYTGGTQQFGGSSTAYQFGGLKGTVNLGLANVSNAGVALTLVCPPGTNATYSGNLNDSGLGGSLTKIGGGAQVLNGTDTYTGNTLIQGGTLSIGGTGSLPGWNVNGRFTVASNAALAVGTGVADGDVDTLLATGNFAAGASLGYDTTAGSRIRGYALGDTGAGALGLLKMGANTLTLSAANTYTGPTVVTGGTLQLGQFNAIPNNGSVTLAGGTYDLGGFANVTNGVVTLSSGSITNGTLYASAFTSSGGTNSANVAGSGGFTNNSGATTFNNINTFTGGLVLNGGTLTLDFASQTTDLVNSGNMLTLAGGTLALKGSSGATDSQTFASTTLSANRGSTITLTTNNAASLTLNLGPITRNTGSTVNFSIVPLTSLVIAKTATASEASGILGPWVTVGATTALQYGAVNGSGQIVSYAGATTTTQPANLSDVSNPGVNYAFGATPTPTQTGPITANTLRYTGAAGNLTNGGFNTTLNGLMNAGTGALTITGTGNLVIGANKELVILANAQGTTINPQIVDNGGGASSLTYSGAGSTLTLNYGTNTYSGGTTINAGTVTFPAFSVNTITVLGTGPVTVNPGATLALGRTYLPNNLTLNNATVTAGNSFASTLAGPITLLGNSIINISGNLNLAGSMSGSGGLTKTNTATLPVTGTNTYTGPTIISAGSLKFTTPASLYNGNTASWTPANIIVASGATLGIAIGGVNDFTPGQVTTLLGNLTTVNYNGLANGAIFAMDTSNGSFTSTNNITDSTGPGGGALGITKFGNNTLVLAGNNTYSGPTSITPLAAGGGGTLSVSSFNSVNGGTPLLASSSLGCPTTVANGTINLGIANIQANATLQYVGPGETTDRVINIALGNANMTQIIDASGGGLLKFTSPLTGGGTSSLQLQGTGLGEIVSPLPVFSKLTKTGTGTWTINGASGYTNLTTINNGALVLKNANALPGGIGTSGGTSALTFNGGVLGLGAGDFTRSLAAAGVTTGVNFNAAGGWAAYGADRVVNLGGASAPISWTTANTGLFGNTLILGAATADSMVTVQNPLVLDQDPCTVQVNDGAAAVDGKLSGVLSGSGGLTKTGAGTLVLAAANTYSGNTTISGGTLALGATGSIANTAQINVAASANFDVTAVGGFTLGNGQTLNGFGTVIGAIIVNGTVSPGPSVGTLNSGSQTWNGGGTNIFALSSATNSAGMDRLNLTGTLDVESSSGNPFTVKLVSMADNITPGLVPDFNANTSYSWVIATASGGILNFDAGKFKIDTGAFSNAYTGTFSVAMQTTNLVVNYTAPPTLLWTGLQSTEWSTNILGGSKNWTLSGSPADYTNGLAVVFAGLPGTSTVDLSVANVTPVGVSFDTSATNYTLQGSKAIAGGTGLTLGGTGTLTILNANTYTGPTTISAGTLQLGDGTSGHDGTIANSPVSNNGALVYNTYGNATYGGVISGSGTVTKTGPGTVMLTNANTYTSLTTVSNGLLYISTAQQLQTQNFAVKDGAGFGVLNFGGGQQAQISGLTLGHSSGASILAFANIADTATPPMIAYGGVSLNGTCTVKIADKVNLVAGNQYPLFWTTGLTTNSGTGFNLSLPAGVTGNLVSIPGPAGIALNVTQIIPINTNPPPLIPVIINGSQFSLSWPTNTGWILQTQTNSVGNGLGTNWVDVAGSDAVTGVTNTINPASGSVFYRLRLP